MRTDIRLERGSQVAAGWLLIVAVATLMQPVAFRGLMGVELAGFPLTTYQNLLILAAAGFAAITFGIRRWLNPVIIAASLLLVLSFTLSTRLPELPPTQSMRTFGTLVLAPLIFELHLPRWVESWLRRIVPWFAVGNLVLAVLAALFLGIEIYRVDWGAFRIAGTIVPAGVAMLAVAALLWSLLAARRQPRWIWLATINFGILVWTGTRVGILAGVVICYGWIVSEALAPNARSRIRQRVAFGLLVPLILLTYAPFMAERMSGYWPEHQQEVIVVRWPGWGKEGGGEGAAPVTEGEGENGIRFTTTGRMKAWRFYYDVARENLWFGRGLGAGVVGGTGHLHESMRLPHNEYLRLLVDGGVVGLGAMALAYLWILIELLRRNRSASIRLLVLVAFGVLAVEASVMNALAAQAFVIPLWLYLGMLNRDAEDPSGAGVGQSTGAAGTTIHR